VGIFLGQRQSRQNQMALVASSPSSAFHMTTKPDSTRKKKRRRKRSKVVEDRRAPEFVTRWRPETTFGYRSFEPGLGEGRVQVVSLDLQPQRTGEDGGDEKKERIKSSKHKRQLYQHSNSPQTLSPPRPWTPRPASVSFLLVEEQQQRQQVRRQREKGFKFIFVTD